MKTRTIIDIAIAAAFGIAAPVALAQASSTVPLTRAEVLAQVHAAQVNGTLMPAGEGWGPEHRSQAESQTPPLNRASVKAQTQAAQEAGVLPAAAGEAPVFAMPATRSTLTRAQVEAETREAVRNGTMPGAAYYPGGPQH